MSKVVVCNVAGAAADACTVDAIARLHLAARRYGFQVRLDKPSRELVELIAFMGLENVLTQRPMP